MIIKCPFRSHRVHDGNEGSMRVMETVHWRVYEGHGRSLKVMELQGGSMKVQLDSWCGGP